MTRVKSVKKTYEANGVFPRVTGGVRINSVFNGIDFLVEDASIVPFIDFSVFVRNILDQRGGVFN